MADMRYDPHTALIVVDVQNDFADPAGSLSVTGGEAVVDAVNTQVEAAVSGGALVAYTQDWHPPSTPHFAKDGGIWPVHCVAETWGAELHPRLVVAGSVVHKGVSGEDGYSGFTMRDPLTGETGLDRSRGAPSGTRHRAGRRRRPGHRLLRPGHRARRAQPRLRDDGPA